MQSDIKAETAPSSVAEIPGYISVHNKSLYSDFVSSLPYQPPKQKQRSAHSQRYSKSANGLRTSLTGTARIDQDAKKEESKKKKIMKYHSELQKWRKNDLKRTLEMIEFKKNKEEAQFRKTLNMIESRGGIYGEISDVLRKEKAQHIAKTTNLHSVWHNEVYHPIIKKIKSTANNEEHMNRRKNKMRNLYEKYLTECNKNGNKIFLDSINVKEYDPFEWTHDEEDASVIEDGTTSHRSKNKVRIRDPLKSDLKKYIVEQKISTKTSRFCGHGTHRGNQTISTSTDFTSETGTSSEVRSNGLDTNSKSNTFSLKPHTRFCISPQQYNHVSHLPVFRDMKVLEDAKVKCILPSHVPGGNVMLNQFDVPKYDAKLVKKQFFPQNKRIIVPPASKYQFNISKQW